MKPLCEKIYLYKIIEIIVVIVGVPADIAFIFKAMDDISWIILAVPFTIILFYLLLDSIYWIFQPKVLIYQYETGIIIEGNKKIEYTEIESISFKNYIITNRRKYCKDPYSGTICIRLKSGKIYRIRNASYPLGAVDAIIRIKQQRKFR